MNIASTVLLVIQVADDWEKFFIVNVPKLKKNNTHLCCISFKYLLGDPSQMAFYRNTLNYVKGLTLLSVVKDCYSVLFVEYELFILMF